MSLHGPCEGFKGTYYRLFWPALVASEADREIIVYDKTSEEPVEVREAEDA